MHVVGPFPNAYGMDLSSDGGRTWQPLGAPAGSEGPLPGAPQLVVARNAPATLVIGDPDGTWLSTDNGRSWRQLSADAHSSLAITPYLPLALVGVKDGRFETMALPDPGAAMTAPVAANGGSGGYAPETGHNLSSLFRGYWEAHGGLAQFGYPQTEPLREVNPADGRIYLAQYFERNRFEYHPENRGTPYEVLLGLLGDQLTETRRAAGEAPFNPVANPYVPDVRYFGETGHTLRGDFRSYWEAHGGLALYGFPISETFSEVNPADGRSYVVQYFERNRLEYHPENSGTPYEVLLGLFGNEVLRQKGWR
jgi:hypothetical protein